MAPGKDAAPVIPGMEVLGTAGRHGAWESSVAVRTRPGTDDQPVLLWRVAPPWRGHARLRTLLAVESATVDGVRHPNVMGVLDVFGDMHDPVLVVEWTEGRNLLAVAQACRQVGASMPVALVAHVLAEVTRGIEAAQVARARRGRPAPLLISPDTVLVGYDGTVRVPCVAALDVMADVPSDLGRIPASRAALVAPEVLSTGEGDMSSEAFSVAAVLYQVLTDALPFPGRTAADVLEAMRRGAPLAPRAINPGVTHAVEELCLRGLHTVASRRAPLAELRQGLEKESAAVTGAAGAREPLAALLQLLFPPGMDNARAWCARMRFSARQVRLEAAAVAARSNAPTMPLLPAYQNPDPPAVGARPEDFESNDTELDARPPGTEPWHEHGPDAAPSGLREIPGTGGQVGEWLEETRKLNRTSGFDDVTSTRRDIPWAGKRPVPTAPQGRKPWWRRLVK